MTAFNVIPGHCAAMNPEPMNTDPRLMAPAALRKWQRLCSWGPGSRLCRAPE